MEDFISGSKVERYPNNCHHRVFHVRHKIMLPNGWYSTDSILSREFVGDIPGTKPTVKAITDIVGVTGRYCSPIRDRHHKGGGVFMGRTVPKNKAGDVSILTGRLLTPSGTVRTNHD